MAVINKAIASSGADYTTLAAFEAAIPADATDQRIGTVTENYQCNTGYFAINVSNANAMAHTITVAEGVRHNRTIGSGARTDGSNVTCDIRTPAFVVQYLECNSTSNASPPMRIVPAAVGAVIDGCYVYKPSAANTECIHIDTTCTVKDTTMVQSAPSKGSCIKCWGDNTKTLTLTNCSMLANNSITGTWDMVTNASQIILCDNNKALSDAVDGISRRSFDTATGISGDYNVGSDTTAPGANSTDNEDPDDHFVSTTLGAHDASMNASLNKSNFIGGDQLAGEFDVDGDERISGYVDIGSDQQSVAATGGVVAKLTSWLRMGMGLGSR